MDEKKFVKVQKPLFMEAWK